MKNEGGIATGRSWYNGLRRLGLLFSILDPLQLLNKPPLNPLGTAHIALNCTGFKRKSCLMKFLAREKKTGFTFCGSRIWRLSQKLDHQADEIRKASNFYTNTRILLMLCSTIQQLGILRMSLTSVSRHQVLAISYLSGQAGVFDNSRHGAGMNRIFRMRKNPRPAATIGEPEVRIIRYGFRPHLNEEGGRHDLSWLTGLISNNVPS
ncbi:uncharacterized protein H6S33_003013 [Morchella sextelata]|uniref:uncharacterized protein n=1 Tax=Morchella sextelata TaxID=1174677 RepID=UPI001D04F05B|nr:uncharacterized protein H6S33_003013 [Morchella sextelata]KAH0607025.1 hypothetical protein H6S33_003013 [Morchella sextelata]